MTVPHEMVEKQLKARGIQDPRVLAAMEKIPRHEFVAHELIPKAYADEPLPIGLDQTISQPYIVAYMTETLEIRPEHKVLEIGTGSGYQTAVLAELARHVYTVEIRMPLLDEAKTRLHRLGYSHIHFKHSDGAVGWPESAPFDRIIMTAAGEKIPEQLADQLGESGRMIFPLGEAQKVQTLTLGTKTNGKMHYVSLMQVRFVPLAKS